MAAPGPRLSLELPRVSLGWWGGEQMNWLVSPFQGLDMTLTYVRRLEMGI